MLLHSINTYSSRIYKLINEEKTLTWLGLVLINDGRRKGRRRNMTFSKLPR